MVQLFQVAVGQLARLRVLHPHQVFLVDRGRLADQVLGDAAVLRQHQQAHRIDVQAPARHQAAQLRRVELFGRRVVGPAVLGLDEGDRRRIAILGLAADIADRLVDQDGHALGLLGGGLALDRDALAGQHLAAQLRDDLAVHPHPAAGDPFIGFAARAQAQFGHTFGEAERFGHRTSFAR